MREKKSENDLSETNGFAIVFKCFQMFANVCKCLQMFANVCKCLRDAWFDCDVLININHGIYAVNTNSLLKQLILNQSFCFITTYIKYTLRAFFLIHRFMSLTISIHLTKEMGLLGYKTWILYS